MNLNCNTSAGQSFTATTGTFRTLPFSQTAEYGAPISKWAALWSGFVQMFAELNSPNIEDGYSTYSSIQFLLDPAYWGT
jgi:hypothetical protein